MNGDRITVRRGTARGEVTLPGSKSITHRAFLLAAQSDTPCTVYAPLRSADTDATIACLHRLGFAVRPEATAVRFEPAQARPTPEPLDCRNAGTALRLLTGLAARLPFAVILDGDESLRRRPNAALIDALRGLGARIEVPGDATRDKPTGAAPFTVRGPVRPGAVHLAAGVSSQYASSLLLSLPLLAGDSTLRMDAPVASQPYLDVTADVAATFGLRWDVTDAADVTTFRVPGAQAPRAAAFHVEGDWSAAAFPLLAAAITDGDVTLHGLRTDSRQGDRAVLDLARRFGVRVDAAPSGALSAAPCADVRVRGGTLVGAGTVNVAATPDLFPALAVLAAASRGTTTFTGGASLRVKESDRIAAVAHGLAAMGVPVKERPDGLVVDGRGTLHSARVHSRGDHRIHMAFAVAGLAADGLTVVDDAHAAAVSYPDFHADLARLAGREVIA